MPGRRTLTFQRLDEIMPDVDRLINGGYTQAGNWPLGMICNHLCGTFVASVDGFPKKFMAPWPVQVTLGKIFKGRILKKGEMPAGIKLPKDALPPPTHDDRAEVEALRAAIAHYSAHQGPVAPHPFFGKMTRDEWDRLNTIHAAHHLSFLIPNG